MGSFFLYRTDRGVIRLLKKIRQIRPSINVFIALGALLLISGCSNLGQEQSVPSSQTQVSTTKLATASPSRPETTTEKEQQTETSASIETGLTEETTTAAVVRTTHQETTLPDTVSEETKSTPVPDQGFPADKINALQDIIFSFFDLNPQFERYPAVSVGTHIPEYVWDGVDFHPQDGIHMYPVYSDSTIIGIGSVIDPLNPNSDWVEYSGGFADELNEKIKNGFVKFCLIEYENTEYIWGNGDLEILFYYPPLGLLPDEPTPEDLEMFGQEEIDPEAPEPVQPVQDETTYYEGVEVKVHGLSMENLEACLKESGYPFAYFDSASTQGIPLSDATPEK